MSRFLRAAVVPLAAAATLLSVGTAPAQAVLGTTTAYKIDFGGDGTPVVEVTLIAQTAGATFNCKAVSTVPARSTRAKCELFQAGTLIASADSGYVAGQTATSSGFRLGSSVFLEACATGETIAGQGNLYANTVCAGILLS